MLLFAAAGPDDPECANEGEDLAPCHDDAAIMQYAAVIKQSVKEGREASQHVQPARCPIIREAVSRKRRFGRRAAPSQAGIAHLFPALQAAHQADQANGREEDAACRAKDAPRRISTSQHDHAGARHEQAAGHEDDEAVRLRRTIQHDVADAQQDQQHIEHEAQPRFYIEPSHLPSTLQALGPVNTI